MPRAGIGQAVSMVDVSAHVATRSETSAAGERRYWWVNQNKTHTEEIDGGFLWSPKTKSNGHRNPFYDSMREVWPGDIVFSFYDTRIQAIGIATAKAETAPKPAFAD